MDAVSAPLEGRRLSLSQATVVGLGADVANVLVALAAVPFLVRRLGTEPYGILGIISVLGGQLGVLQLGIGAAGSRVVAEAVGAGDRAALSRRVLGVWVVGAGAAVLMWAAFMAIAPFAWARGFTLSEELRGLALRAVAPGALVVAMTPVSAAVHGVLRGRGRFGVSASLRGAHGVGRLGGAVLAVVGGGGVLAVLWTQAAIDTIALLFGGVAAHRGAEHVGARAARGPSFSMADLRPVLRVGVPLALAGLFAPLLLDAEKLFVGVRMSVDAFTHYAVPFNAVFRLIAVAAAVEAVVTPRLATLGAGAASGAADAAFLSGRVTRVLGLSVTAVCVPLVAFMPELLGLWLGGDFPERSTLPAQIVLLGLAFNAVAVPAHSVILARMPTWTLVWLYAAEVAVHVPVVFWLVTRFGLAGAAAAWSLRTLVDALAQRAIAARHLGRRVGSSIWTWAPSAALAAFVALASVTGPWTRGLAGTALMAACGAPLLFGETGRHLRGSLLRRPGGA